MLKKTRYIFKNCSCFISLFFEHLFSVDKDPVRLLDELLADPEEFREVFVEDILDCHDLLLLVL